MAEGGHASRPFFSAHPVFRREEYARAVNRQSEDGVVTTMLTQHLRAGNIRRVARGVFASVPPHGDAATWHVDRFLAASRLKADAVIAYHSALELHGCAYTVAANVQAISAEDPTIFITPDFTCRFFKLPRGYVADRDTEVVDRAGLDVRVTTLERTIVDVLLRHDLAGGEEEIFNSLALVERVKTDVLLRQARSARSPVLAAVLGWWLERERKRLGVSVDVIERLRAAKPNNPRYALGAKAGDAKSVRAWNIFVPRALAQQTFEGL